MGNINISTAKTKAYANKQRTINNEHYSKQTQSNPIQAQNSSSARPRATCGEQSRTKSKGQSNPIPPPPNPRNSLKNRYPSRTSSAFTRPKNAPHSKKILEVPPRNPHVSPIELYFLPLNLQFYRAFPPRIPASPSTPRLRRVMAFPRVAPSRPLECGVFAPDSVRVRS